MSVIPLRQYNREIEGMVESGQVAEAIAHCRHILQSYPKHIQTYRMLGKIHLESQQYSDAIDIFLRLLAVVPDDFISHVGMSIIREDENNLEAAIWHMERAFEVQPSNSAIQEELRRLYGRRDGMEPPKIRLTRGALARMYARGHLYEQAIAELRAALSDDPQRVDLQVLLAQMYYHTKQFVEAIETCGLILKKYPYCQDANRLLAVILPETNRAGDTAVYRQRLVAMDPYYASAPPNSLSSDSVPDNSVTIERLIYRPGTGGPEQPAWASSLGITLEQDKSEQLPEWLQETESSPALPNQVRAPQTLPPSLQEPPSETPMATAPGDVEEVLPDWMKEAGWQPSSGETIEGPEPVDAVEAEDEISKGDIPDWLKGLAPAGMLEDELPPMDADEGSSGLPWLDEKTPGASDTVKNWLDETQPADLIPSESEQQTTGSSQGLPDWLSELQEESQPVEEQAPKEEEEQLPAWLTDLGKPLEPPSGVTDWLRTASLPEEPSLSEPPLETEPTSSEEIPDWLQETRPSQAEVTTPPDEIAPDEIEEVPAWLQEWGTPASESPAPEPIPPAEGPDLDDEDAALAWLESLAAQQGAPEEELITKPEERPSMPPDWVKAELEPEATPATELPDWLQELKPAELEPTPEPIEPTSTSEEAGEPGELPDWLREMEEEGEGLAAEAETPTVVPESTPNWVPEVEITTPESLITPEAEGTQPGFNLSDEDAALAWLESLAAQHGAKEEELITKPEDRLLNPPDWVLEESEAELSTSEESRAETEELPAWLQEEPELSGPEASAEAEPAEELPAWLSEEAAAEAEIPIQIEPIEELPSWLTEEATTAEPVIPIEAEPAEELPPWLLEEPTTPTPEAPVEAEPAEETPAWQQEESPAQVPESTIKAEPTEELPAWLMEEPAAPTLEAAIEAEPAEELPTWLLEEPIMPISQASVEAEPAEELPTWLQEEPAAPDLELPTPPVQAEEMPLRMEEEPPIPISERLGEPMLGEELPGMIEEQPTADGGVVDVNTASLAELERLPGVGFIIASNIVAYREANGSLTSIDDLGKIPGITPGILAEIRNLVTIGAIPTPAPEVVTVIPGEYDEILVAARRAMESGKPATSLEMYSSLVKKNQRLDTIIQELQDALYHFPVNVDIWQTLGDAYLRNDNLREALDAYTKAEELLR